MSAVAAVIKLEVKIKMADTKETMKLHILLEEQENINLIGLLFPGKTEPAGLVWRSDNEETATVTAAGVVTGVKAGTAKITVKTADSSMEDSVMVLVMGKEDSGLRLSILLKPTEKCRLVVMFWGAQGTAKWASADETVATVDQGGRVTAVAAGTALITVTSEDGSMTDQVYVTVRGEAPAPKPTGVYGIRIDKDEPDPDKRVTYLYDAVGKRPARMDYEAGVFDYGDWADVWFVKENKPCMLKYDGTVDYYLDPDDNSKKEDGSDSDVANESFEGNAMAEFPLIWMKQYEKGQYEYILVSNHQVDEDYTAYPYTREDGSIADKLYLRMFEGSFDGSIEPYRTRSLSNRQVSTSKYPSAHMGYAANNGKIWCMTAWCEWDMIDSLLRILSKSTNFPRAFGHGNAGPNAQALKTGTMDALGQFYGVNGEAQGVKIFHMENWWGNYAMLMAGLVTNSGSEVLIKQTPPYVITEKFDNVESLGYVNSNMIIPNGFIMCERVSSLGKIPVAVLSKGGTYYCAHCSSSTNSIAEGGGYWQVGGSGLNAVCSASTLSINNTSGNTSGAAGTGLSARSPKTE